MANLLPDLGPLSYFWAPLCAVGSHGERGPNAQICLSIAGASIVPDRQRLTVSLWKTNHTHDLVRDAGTMAITLLHESQLALLDALGLHSGRDTDKLAELQYNLTEAGDPWFPGGVALLACDVLDALDLGDATSFLCAVRHQERLREGAPITWPEARTRMSDAFNQRYNEKSSGDIDWSRPRMTWRE
jgi:flavin reductase (DIM6/NTAB) family NADH-FMN oxidoreductase RutF